MSTFRPPGIASSSAYLLPIAIQTYPCMQRNMLQCHLMSTPALEIKNLKKRCAPGTEALKAVSLSVPAGDSFALLGPNGAGKTTIIGISTGLVNKTEGDVSVFGHDIDKDPEMAKAQIGLVGQEINFNPFEK